MNMLLAVLSALLVTVSIPATGLPGVLLALAGIACALVVMYRIRGGGRR